MALTERKIDGELIISLTPENPMPLAEDSHFSVGSFAVKGTELKRAQAEADVRGVSLQEVLTEWAMNPL